MNFFVMTKTSNLQENVLYSAKVLYELIENESHLDELFTRYAKKEDVLLNLNIERVLYLSLTFLFALDLVIVENNMVKKVVK